MHYYLLITQCLISINITINCFYHNLCLSDQTLSSLCKKWVINLRGRVRVRGSLGSSCYHLTLMSGEQSGFYQIYTFKNDVHLTC